MDRPDRPFLHRMVFVVATTGQAPTSEHAEKVRALLESHGYAIEYVGEWLPGGEFPCPDEEVDTRPKLE